MAFAGEEAQKQLREMTESSICMSDFTDPRMLPCIHTFCFECAKRTSEEAQKKPGDKMPCPLCRKEFTIPLEGIIGLQINFFMGNLLEYKTTLQSNDPTPEIECDVEQEIEQITAVKTCHKHQKPLDFYCADCKIIVCVLCFVKSHKLHDCKDIAAFDEKLRQTIKKYEWKVSNYADEIMSSRKNTEKKKSCFLEKIMENENKIHQSNQELKNPKADRHAKSLLDELSGLKSKHLKEIEIELEDTDKYCTILRSFEAYCTELRLKGSASDICSSVGQLIVKADELERDHEAFIGRSRRLLFVDFLNYKGSHLYHSNVNRIGELKAVRATAIRFENCVVFVGLNDGISITSDVIKINLHYPNTISVQHQMTTSMQIEATAAVFCNIMYITGTGTNNDEIWKYNSNSGWMKCSSLVQGRHKHSAAFIDEVLYVCGGFVDSTKTALDSVEAYNAITNKCTTVGKLVHSVHSSGNCVPFRKLLYIFGGKDKDNSIPSNSIFNLFGILDKDVNAYSHVQIYNTKKNTCTLLSTPMPRPSYLMRAVLWQTSVILLGRFTCYLFNLETETWQERKQYKTDVVHFGLVLGNERIFVIGGGDNETYKDGTEMWKCRDDVRSVPLQNVIENKSVEWEIYGKLPEPSLVHACAKLRFPL